MAAQASIWFVDALNKGTLSINNIAIAILDGAQGADKGILDAKLASADLFTKALDTPAEVGGYVGTTAADAGRAFLAGVTTSTAKTAKDADDAITTMPSVANKGNAIILTGGADTLSLTSAVGGTKATDLNDTINAAVAGDWVAGDAINAGFGTDTLNATVALDVTVAADGLKSVEIINITATAAKTVDVANAKDLTQVWDSAFYRRAHG